MHIRANPIDFQCKYENTVTVSFKLGNLRRVWRMAGVRATPAV